MRKKRHHYIINCRIIKIMRTNLTSKWSDIKATTWVKQNGRYGDKLVNPESSKIIYIQVNKFQRCIVEAATITINSHKQLLTFVHDSHNTVNTQYVAKSIITECLNCRMTRKLVFYVGVVAVEENKNIIYSFFGLLCGKNE